MREIKFRGKRTENGEWVYGMPAYNRDCTGIDKIEEPMASGGICRLVDPDTVGQYIGLKDQAGKDIYVGDIVDFRDGKVQGIHGCRQIEFKDGAFGIRPLNRMDEELWWACVWHMNCEVISNIYEHPHLLPKEAATE